MAINEATCRRPTQSPALRSRTRSGRLYGQLQPCPQTRSGRPYGPPPRLHRASMTSRGSRPQRMSPETMPMLQWAKLPVEIRLMILEELQNQGERQAPYAQVSHEWRVFVERSTFRRLVLSSGDLDAFRSLIARRRTNVYMQVPIRHIWLRLVLPEYNCPDCRRPENSSEAAANDRIFTEAMWNLLMALALLVPDRGLTLEFSAHSPSDSAHFFKSWYQLRSDYPHFAAPDEHFAYVNRAKKYLPTNDKAHGYGGNLRARWIRRIGGRTLRQCEYAQRLVRPLKFISTEYASPPRAPCVTDLLIRRQYFRDIETSSLSYLLGSLPSLQGLRRENWRHVNLEERYHDRDSLDPIHGHFSRKHLREGPLPFGLTTQLPASLTHLQLFQDFDAQIHGRVDVHAPQIPRMYRLLPSLARLTPNLQVFSVSFLADAIDIFGLRHSYLMERPDDTIWDEATRQHRIDTATYYYCSGMESVVLTSQEYLRPDQNRSKVNFLLRGAAAVALKMPKLKTMELWNCGQGQACVFRYEAVDYSGSEPDHSCRLTWRSTWAHDLEIEPAVLEAWEAVARARGYPPILFERRPLPVGVREREYVSHHDLLRLGALKLARYVLHETSRAQASAEADMTPDAFMWYTG